MLYQMLFQQISSNFFCASQAIGKRIDHQGGTMLCVTCSIDGRLALVLNAMRALDHNGANSASVDNLSTQSIIDATFGSRKLEPAEQA